MIHRTFFFRPIFDKFTIDINRDTTNVLSIYLNQMIIFFIHNFLMSFVLFIFFNVICIVFGGASNSYEDCQRLAAKFFTTDNSESLVNVTCSQLTGVACPGSIVNGVCTWQRKFTVKCINGSTVRIRVQSNGLPSRCASMPSTVTFATTNIDFEVNFNPNVNVNSPFQSASSSAALDKIVCNTSSQRSVPSTSAYVSYSTPSVMNTVAGIALDGVPILNVNSINQVDPFYPTGGYSKEGVDACLSHPNGNGVYHYHIASGCIVSPPKGTLSSCSPNSSCGKNVANYSVESFPSSAKTLTVIGLAKDGHIIYGPYTSDGLQVKSGFDICNGMFFDTIGNYGYFATNTYPYITGCFGPGNYPSWTPTCTTNGPTSYTMSSFASSFKNK